MANIKIYCVAMHRLISLLDFLKYNYMDTDNTKADSEIK